MGYIAFASAKGSPGVTTAVTALAATWPAGRELVMVELDPAGGDLVVRFDLPAEPGLVSLAAAGRREMSAATLLAHSQELPVDDGDDVAPRRVLVAPVSAEQSSAALGALRGTLAAALADLDADVLVDCGRLDAASGAHDVAMAADLLVAVARPRVADVHHLGTRLASLSGAPVSLLTVGDRPYGVGEVAEAVGAHALGTLPDDVRAATALTGGRANAVRVLRRSRLLRDARALAEGLADWMGPRTPRPGAGARAFDAGGPPPTDGHRPPPPAPVGERPAPLPPPLPPPPPSEPAAYARPAPVPPATERVAPDHDVPGPSAAGDPPERRSPLPPPPNDAGRAGVAARIRRAEERESRNRADGGEPAPPKHFRRPGERSRR